MKLTLKGVLAVSVGMLLFYASCKKNSTSPTKTANEKTVAGIIAVNLAQSLAGTYGGVSINDGVVAPTTISNKSPLCGYTIDTTVTYTTNVGDTAKSTITGKFDFQYTCSGNYPDGYVVTTSVTDKGRAPTDSFYYSLAQMYTVQALNAQYSAVSVNGTLKSFGDFKNINKPGTYIDTNFAAKPIYEHQSYVLHNLQINIANNLDIVSGTATYTSTGSGSFGSWNYSGTIVFTGNHMAVITINGTAYNVNLITGAATPV